MKNAFEQIDNLYKKYSLEILEKSKNYRVYLYNSGYFSNVEIVYISEFCDIDNLIIKYTELGYSVRQNKFESIEKLEEDLFKGFFNTKLSKQREKKEYEDYCKLLTKKLNTKYTYIDCKYMINGNSSEENLINYITSQLHKPGAQLIILEASAGFGKTCTSYEVYNRLANLDDNNVAILAELSKNRTATIFRYVLLSEINRSFTQLSAELVTSEIKKGRVILIVDGFDELLHVDSAMVETDVDTADNAQTMLDTISEVFTGESEAKVILTARKSSIFTGETFDNWVEKRIENCNINRIQIEPPTITSWLGSDKITVLNQKHINIENVANPVLLSFLRNMSIEKLSETIHQADDILDQYFEIMLTREKDRQSLLLSVEEQKTIMYSLAKMMVQFGISEDTPDFIIEMLEEITKKQIEEYLNRYEKSIYGIEDKPTKEQFYNRLSHHALLDRIYVNKNLIGFVSNFIFGLFIGEAICKEEFDINEIDIKFIDLAATAFEVKTSDERVGLLSCIKKKQNLRADFRFYLDMKLTYAMQENYSGISVEENIFKQEFAFSKEFVFDNCIFNNCIFINCKIPANVFQNSQFYNCKFYDVEIDGHINKNSNIFCACEGIESFYVDETHDPIEETNTSYERRILEQFWKPGSDTAELYRSYTTIFKGFSQSERKNIEKTVNMLIDNNILIKQLHCLKLNIRKLDEIKVIIGR